MDVLKTPRGHLLEELVRNTQICPRIRGTASSRNLSSKPPITIDSSIDIITVDMGKRNED